MNYPIDSPVKQIHCVINILKPMSSQLPVQISFRPSLIDSFLTTLEPQTGLDKIGNPNSVKDIRSQFFQSFFDVKVDGWLERGKDFTNNANIDPSLLQFRPGSLYLP